jgi:protein subunit release factor B
LAKELLFSITKSDFEIQTFRAGGKGGQNQNKVSSGVRVIHRDSGAKGEGRDSREQPQNKKNAFIRCVNSPKFQAWLKTETSRRMGELDNIQERVDRMLSPEYLKIEYFEPDGVTSG